LPASCSSTRQPGSGSSWADFAQATVAALRRESGRRPHDARLSTLIDELRTADPDVARWWDDHAVRDYASVAKRIRHPAGGDLSFDIESVSAPQEPDQRLVVYTTDPTRRPPACCRSWPVGATRSPAARTTRSPG